MQLCCRSDGESRVTLESQGVEIVGTPVMDAALMLDSMQLTTSTKIHYVQKVVNKRGEKHVNLRIWKIPSSH